MAETDPVSGGEQRTQTSAEVRARITERFLNNGLIDRIMIVLADENGYEPSDHDQLILLSDPLHSEVSGEVCSYVRTPIGQRFLIGFQARIADNLGNHWPTLCIAEQFDGLDYPFNTLEYEFSDEEMLEMVAAIKELERAKTSPE